MGCPHRPRHVTVRAVQGESRNREDNVASIEWEAVGQRVAAYQDVARGYLPGHAGSHGNRCLASA